MTRVCRYERLEEQLNDLTELHQNEMTNLKQELASMEEKVAYQSYERARDIQVTVRSSARAALASNIPAFSPDRAKGCGGVSLERGGVKLLLHV